ncbi:MAG: methyltransferase domain-containing protein [Candidatus Brocadiae bacterium]|nr:methyltransferase domain-containing protein [Candidatus Brocadiia bacterium]
MPRALPHPPPAPPPRAELFRTLADNDRLTLLALCAQEELAVSELATITRDSQPQITKKTHALRDAALLLARRDGNRTLLRTADSTDPVVLAALAEGRALAARSGALGRVAGVVAQREESSRRFFEDASQSPILVEGSALLPFLPVLAPLVPNRALAVDVGTGEGAFLPMLAALFERVIGVDRSPARLARCAARLQGMEIHNVRLCSGDVDDPAVQEEIRRAVPGGGADLVLLARVLHHAALPGETLAAAARLAREGGRLLIVDYLPHDDESLREQGDVWLGFAPEKLHSLAVGAGLAVESIAPLPLRLPASEPDRHLPWQLAVLTACPSTKPRP